MKPRQPPPDIVSKSASSGKMSPCATPSIDQTDALEPSPHFDKNGNSLAGKAQPTGATQIQSKGDGQSSPNKKLPKEQIREQKQALRFAALDLGTNNCRLLIAAPKGKDMRIVDAYSHIVRLGEGLSRTGSLSENAMARTIKVLKICAEKIRYRGVTHMRLIATQACRASDNGEEFIRRVKKETGLNLEIISAEEEARLVMMGCEDLFDTQAKNVLVFDIGGGSTELAWVKVAQNTPTKNGQAPHEKNDIINWASLPIGVVSLAEKWNGKEINRETYEKIIDEVAAKVANVGDAENLRPIFESGYGHLLGSSGTVTCIAAVHLKLERYRRMEVDGLWLSHKCVQEVSEELRSMTFDQRANQPCIGPDRADLVICGCAILEGIMRHWPSERVRVADRGLREGILLQLSQQAHREKRKRFS